jgi:hypothetical protein
MWKKLFLFFLQNVHISLERKTVQQKPQSLHRKNRLLSLTKKFLLDILKLGLFALSAKNLNETNKRFETKAENVFILRNKNEFQNKNVFSSLGFFVN